MLLVWLINLIIFCSTLIENLLKQIFTFSLLSASALRKADLIIISNCTLGPVLLNPSSRLWLNL